MRNTLEVKRRCTTSGKAIENNKTNATGETVPGFTFSHEALGEGLYMVDVAVSRPNEQTDIIPLMISERLTNVHKDYSGSTAECIGQLRSYNRYEGIRNWPTLFILAREIHFIEESTDYTRTNQVSLNGCICKPSIYRKTPPGRETADILLAVNRPYGKSDYIPCVSWGRNARFASSSEVGTRVRVWGCMQSREYTKKLSETECEKRIVYGVFINKLECDGA